MNLYSPLRATDSHGAQMGFAAEQSIFLGLRISVFTASDDAVQESFTLEKVSSYFSSIIIPFSSGRHVHVACNPVFAILTLHQEQGDRVTADLWTSNREK